MSVNRVAPNCVELCLGIVVWQVVWILLVDGLRLTEQTSGDSGGQNVTPLDSFGEAGSSSPRARK